MLEDEKNLLTRESLLKARAVLRLITGEEEARQPTSTTTALPVRKKKTKKRVQKTHISLLSCLKSTVASRMRDVSTSSSNVPTVTEKPPGRLRVIVCPLPKRKNTKTKEIDFSPQSTSSTPQPNTTTTRRSTMSTPAPNISNVRRSNYSSQKTSPLKKSKNQIVHEERHEEQKQVGYEIAAHVREQLGQVYQSQLDMYASNCEDLHTKYRRAEGEALTHRHRGTELEVNNTIISKRKKCNIIGGNHS